MQIMQPKLIDQCLLDLLVQDKKTVGVDGAAFEFERCRHVAIDVDRLTVEAIAGKIRNVVLAIKLLHSPADSIKRTVHHQARDVPLGQFEFFVRGGGMTQVQRHG
jgi:hypothetical protein